jgi:hypothetical protein
MRRPALEVAGSSAFRKRVVAGGGMADVYFEASVVVRFGWILPRETRCCSSPLDSDLVLPTAMAGFMRATLPGGAIMALPQSGNPHGKIQEIGEAAG